MWLAHLLTAMRVPLLAVLWVANDPWIIGGAIGAAALSDLFDGPVARRAKRLRPPPWPRWWSIGGWLDPAVDKLFVVGALAALYVRARPPVAWLALIGAREALMVPLVVGYLLVRRGDERRPLSADTIGKVTTAAQLIALAIIALGAAPPVCWAAASVCAALGVTTIVHYARTRTHATLAAHG